MATGNDFIGSGILKLSPAPAITVFDIQMFEIISELNLTNKTLRNCLNQYLICSFFHVKMRTS